MQSLLLIVAALAVASAAVYPGQPLLQPVAPYYQKPALLAHAQPLYTSDVFPKYISQPAPYVHHVPSTYSSSVVEKYHHHAPTFGGLAYGPRHHYVEKVEKVHHHAAVPVIAHAPVLGAYPYAAYTAIPKAIPAPYQYVEKKFQHAAVPSTEPRILQQARDMDPSDGSYRFAYATENGIQASEQSVIKGVTAEGPVAAKEGSYSYTGPDGVEYSVNWVADENGYRASGEHIPQIPEEIKRSLEFNAANPSVEDSLRN